MKTQNHLESGVFAPSKYEVCIEGRLGPQTIAWFEDMTVTINEETSQTIIQGYIVDQAALYGLISRVRDLGLTLVSVKRLEDDDVVESQILGQKQP